MENETGRLFLSKEAIEQLSKEVYHLDPKDYDEKGIYIVRIKQESGWDLCIFVDPSGSPILNNTKQFDMLSLYLELELNEAFKIKKMREELDSRKRKEIAEAMKESRHPNLRSEDFELVLDPHVRSINSIMQEMQKLNDDAKEFMLGVMDAGATDFFQKSFSLDIDKFKKKFDKLHSK